MPTCSTRCATSRGVSVSGGSNFQDIFIRGLPGAYTLTLVDGRRQSTRDARCQRQRRSGTEFHPARLGH